MFLGQSWPGACVLMCVYLQECVCVCVQTGMGAQVCVRTGIQAWLIDAFMGVCLCKCVRLLALKFTSCPRSALRQLAVALDAGVALIASRGWGQG